MKKIAIVGAGRIGAAIADMLDQSGDYAVTVLDSNIDQLGALDTGPGVNTARVDVAAPGALEGALAGHYAVLSAAPFHLTEAIARAAVAAGVHYLDLTEDVKSTRIVKSLAETARSALVPQCGLAPGFISIAAHSLAARFDTLEAVKMRVGALPQFPDNALGYALTWSPEGVINEYCEPCEAIADGKMTELAPLEDCETFTLEGVRYEAFNTSGGLGSICQSLLGKVRELNYRTIRYPGHAAIMKILLKELDLAARRDLALSILTHVAKPTDLDVVVILVEVTGTRNGAMATERFARRVYSGHIGTSKRSAIQITTAAGICTVLDMLAKGHLPQRGFVNQDQIGLDAFLANRFGRAYEGEAGLERVA